MILLQCQIICYPWSCRYFMTLESCLHLDVVHGVCHPGRYWWILWLAYYPVVQWYTIFTVASGEVINLVLLSLYASSFAILLCEILEQKHKCAEEERCQDEEDQILRVFECENQIFIDQQSSLRHKSWDMLTFLVFMGWLGWLRNLRTSWERWFILDKKFPLKFVILFWLHVVYKLIMILNLTNKWQLYTLISLSLSF